MCIRDRLGDRQQKQETVDEYLTRHKHFANLVEAHMCEGFMDEYQKTTAELKKAVTQKEMDNILKRGFERWKAYVFWRGADNDKYGELKARFVDDYTQGIDRYPWSHQEARNILVNHKIEAKYYEKVKKAKEDEKKKKKDKEDKKSSQKSEGKGHQYLSLIHI